MKKATILLYSYEKYEGYVLRSRGTRHNRRQPDAGVRGLQEHGSPPSPILQWGCRVEAHVILDAVVLL